MRRVVVGFVFGLLLCNAGPAQAQHRGTEPPPPPRPVSGLDTTRQSPPHGAPGTGPAEAPGDGERRRGPGSRPPPTGAPNVEPRGASWGSIGALDRHVQKTLERASDASRRSALARTRASGLSARERGAAAVAPSRRGAAAGATREASEELPSRIAFGPAFPNPSTGGISFRVDLPRAASVRIRILDVAGRQVDEFGGPRVAGRHTLTWDGRSRAPRSGVYFASLAVDGRGMGERRLVVLR